MQAMFCGRCGAWFEPCENGEIMSMPRVGSKVHYHPIFGRPHDGCVYVVTRIEQLHGNPNQMIAWLDGKTNCVALEALEVIPETPEFIELCNAKKRIALLESTLTAAQQEATRLTLENRDLTAKLQESVLRESRWIMNRGRK
jgi:hypothetical protein